MLCCETPVSQTNATKMSKNMLEEVYSLTLLSPSRENRDYCNYVFLDSIRDRFWPQLEKLQSDTLN